VRHLEDQNAKEKQRFTQQIQGLESYIAELKGDVRQRDEEIERAIKVHRANERLSKDLNEHKSLCERLREELKNLRAERERDHEQC
jgi:outer membrane murein-binding lipoprotein Lpp